MLHPTSSIVELNSAVASNVNVVYDQQPVSTMGEQGDSTAMNSNTAAIPGISTNIGIASLSEIRRQQDQSRSHTCTRGLIHAVRRIPGEAVVVPCSATLVPVSEDTVSEDVGVCCERVRDWCGHVCCSFSFCWTGNCF